MARKEAEDHLVRLSEKVEESDLVSNGRAQIFSGGSTRGKRAKGGRSVLDSLVGGKETAEEILENTPADILLDCVRLLLRLQVAVLFSASRDDGSLLVTLYENGQKRFLTPSDSHDFVSRLEALLLQGD